MKSSPSDTLPRIDFGRRLTVVRRGRITIRWGHRTAAVCAVLAVSTAAVVVWSLMSGSFGLGISEVADALRGRGDPMALTVVREWRLPRALAAAIFGAGLGVSGAIFQSLTRNPLASPDVIGFSTGSYTGALIVLTGVGASYELVAVGALIGGLGTAAVVYLLAYKRGIQGFRLIVVGIAVSAMLAAANTWMLMRAQLEVALAAAVWGRGSLNGIVWSQAAPACVVVVVLLAAVGAVAAPMRQMELGDDAAKALGAEVERTRLILLLIGVSLTAAVTAAAGPVAFVALAAPQVARRLARSPGVALSASACTGALLLTLADHVAQHLFPEILPVGVVTVVIGGVYLVWLLIDEQRRHHQ